jgi:GAF domain-containing protein
VVSAQRSDEIVSKLAATTLRGSELRRAAMKELARLHGYNWCGIYILDGEGLRLAEFVGAATDHIFIPIGRGVCGAAVAENRNQIVEDVRTLENYLACSIQTRSEIVVLIRRADGTILGQIDIDGHEVGAFDETDERLLERLGTILAERWE